MYKNAFIDLDGTMLNKRRKLTEASLISIEKLIKNNIGVTICTGRWPISSMEINNKIEKYTSTKNKYLISLNGALIYNVENQEVLKTFNISIPLFKKLLQIAKHFKLRLLIYNESGLNKSIAYSDKIRFKFLFKNLNGGKIKKIKWKKFNIIDDTLKVLFISMSRKKIEKTFNFLKNNMSEYYHLTKVSKYMIEITSLEASKGNAVKYICDQLKINTSEAVCFGDSSNDISMFEETLNGYCVNPKSYKLRELSRNSFYGDFAFSNAIDFSLNANNNIIINFDDINEENIKEIISNNGDTIYYFYTKNKIVTLDVFNKIKNIVLDKKFFIFFNNNFIVNSLNQIIYSKYIDNLLLDQLKKRILALDIKCIDINYIKIKKGNLDKFYIQKIKTNCLKASVNKNIFEIIISKNLINNINVDLSDLKLKLIDNNDSYKIVNNLNPNISNKLNVNETVVYSRNKIELFDKCFYKK